MRISLRTFFDRQLTIHTNHSEDDQMSLTVILNFQVLLNQNLSSTTVIKQNLPEVSRNLANTNCIFAQKMATFVY